MKQFQNVTSPSAVSPETESEFAPRVYKQRENYESYKPDAISTQMATYIDTAESTSPATVTPASVNPVVTLQSGDTTDDVHQVLEDAWGKNGKEEVSDGVGDTGAQEDIALDVMPHDSP